jgi:hypothetical protein
MSESVKLNEIKDHLVQISAQLVRMAARVSRLEKAAGVNEAIGVASLPDLEFAARHAIDECRANSSRHLKPVLTAARVELEAKAYDVGLLSNPIKRSLGKKFS